MKRWIPRTMSGWFVTVVLAALVLSQAVTLGFMLMQTQLVAVNTFQTQTLERIASIVRLMNYSAAEAFSDQVLLEGAANSPTFTAQLAQKAMVEPAQSNDLLSARLARMLGGTRVALVRVSPHSSPLGLLLSPPLRVSSEARERADAIKFLPQSTSAAGNAGSTLERKIISKEVFSSNRLDVSVQLTGGRWLNISAVPSPVPLQVSLQAWPLLFGSVLAAVAVTLATVLVARRIARPLKELSIAAQHLGRDKAITLATEAGPEDLRQVMIAFNEMSQRLRRVLAEQRALLSSVGHDLRTPITSLRIRAEFIEDPDLKQKMLETLADMERLTLAALEAARGSLSSEPLGQVELASLVEATCEDLAELGGKISWQPHPRLFVPARASELRRALRNLVENAVRHAGGAQVFIESHPNEVHLVVEDEGRGIPEHLLQSVQEPFVQLDSAQDSKSQGYGLGLTIVRSIAERHGGSLSLQNRATGGLSARLILPCHAQTG